MGTDLANTITDKSPLTITSVFCSKNNRSSRNHQVVKQVRLVLFEISSKAKSKALMTCESV